MSLPKINKGDILVISPKTGPLDDEPSWEILGVHTLYSDNIIYVSLIKDSHGNSLPYEYSSLFLESLFKGYYVLITNKTFLTYKLNKIYHEKVSQVLPKKEKGIPGKSERIFSERHFYGGPEFHKKLDEAFRGYIEEWKKAFD